MLRTSPIFGTERPPLRRSPFLAEDPRFLIGVFALIVLATFFVPRTAGQLGLVAYVVGVAVLAGVPLRLLAPQARVLAVFIGIVIAINAVLVGGEPLPAPLAFLSRRGIIDGVFHGARVAALYSTVAVLLFLTTPETLSCGVSAILRPLSARLARRAALFGFLTMGFLPLFADEVDRIQVAQRFRGGGLGGGWLRRIAGVRLLLVPIISSAIRRSAQLAMVVELRGIQSSIGELLWLGRPKGNDFVFTAVTVAVVAGALWV